MSRYIDADKLSIHFKALVEHAEMEGLYNHAHLYKRCLELIEDTPTADAVEVRHGEWETIPDYSHALTTFRHICSECNVFYKDILPLGHNYCYNCGAKMDGERRKDNEG